MHRTTKRTKVIVNLNGLRSLLLRSYPNLRNSLRSSRSKGYRQISIFVEGIEVCPRKIHGRDFCRERHQQARDHGAEKKYSTEEPKISRHAARGDGFPEAMQIKMRAFK